MASSVTTSRESSVGGVIGIRGAAGAIGLVVAGEDGGVGEATVNLGVGEATIDDVEGRSLPQRQARMKATRPLREWYRK